jgi:serine/threonine protein kinase
MLVGKLPFDDPSPASLAYKHITYEPPAPRQINPDLSPEIEAVLLQALRKMPQERYRTGNALIAALEGVIPGESAEIRVLNSAALPPATLPFLPGDQENQSQYTPSTLAPNEIQPPAPPVQPSPKAVFNIEGSVPTVVSRPRLALPNKRTILTAVLAVSILACLCISLFAANWLSGKLTRPTPVSAAHPSPTSVVSPTRSNPTGTPTSEFHLLLVLQKTDSLVVINQGTAGLPLALLRLGNGKDELTGDQWETKILNPGQCVFVSKKEGHKGASPQGMQCQLVGKILERGGASKFWNSAFDIYFQDVLVDSCNLEESSCTLQFSISPSR